jgi:hypothetical protein
VEHAKGVCEVPNGSNWGPEIKKYGGQRGWAWCCLFAGWVEHVAFGEFPLGAKYALCKAAWNRGREMGRTFAAVYDQLRPGQRFMMLNANGTGHTGIILSVSEDGKWVNTIEGNAGNRVKVGKRPVSQFAGVLDFFDLPFNTDFQHGLLAVKPTAGDSTR